MTFKNLYDNVDFESSDCLLYTCDILDGQEG